MLLDHVRLLRRAFLVLAAASFCAIAMPGGQPSAAAAPASAAADDGVATGHYKFPARLDPLVANDRETELWAHVWRPAKLGKNEQPLVVFLHGNHGTCGRFDPEKGVRVDDRADYTTTGHCPEGYVVTPNHMGYDYLGRRLAMLGYLVVSINANRGITAGAGRPEDGGLNLMRGRLVMRHLALLAEWNAGKGQVPKSLGFDPEGHIDFREVGLMGHSRGGEGMRAALQQMREDSRLARKVKEVRIRAIFEIGPVDGQTSRVLNADGAASAVLLPVCDGDVSDLGGMRVFDRALKIKGDDVQAIKATVGVYGANHNYYNTEWQESDSLGCIGYPPMFGPLVGSEQQRKTGVETLVPFFAANVGAGRDPSLNAVFDAGKRPPAALRKLATVERNYLHGPVGGGVKVLQRFTGPSGFSDSGAKNKAVGVTVEHTQVIDSFPGLEHAVPHDPSIHWATLEWDGAGKHFYEVVVAGKAGLRLNRFETLAFRAALRCRDGEECAEFPADRKPEIAVALVGTDGTVSPAVDVAAHRWLEWPSIDFATPSDVTAHAMLSTIRVPVGRFEASATKRVRAIRFIFSGQESGRVALSGITVDRPAGEGAGDREFRTVSPATAASPTPAEVAMSIVPSPPGDQNTIRVGRPDAPTGAATAGTDVAVTLTSNRPFPFTDALPVLWIGDAPFTVSEIGADRRSIVFRIPADAFATIETGAPVRLQIGRQPSWSFGGLPK
jgi:hypothetical protein